MATIMICNGGEIDSLWAICSKVDLMNHHGSATKSLGDGESYDDDRDGISCSEYQDSLENKVERCFDSICYSSSAPAFIPRKLSFRMIHTAYDENIDDNSIISTNKCSTFPFNSHHSNSSNRRSNNASLSIFAPPPPKPTNNYKSWFRKKISSGAFDYNLDQSSSSS
mmetsp:Transcript_11688/g.17153  ORF Transcript_11688/g.17153 Transcript_11688/m.17153 type:complete len:167 (+) Transcript_11688:91-591(+)